MSYTHAQVSWKACTLANSSIVDEYGDIERKAAINIIARKQPHSEVITDAQGKTYVTRNIYYVDPKVEPFAFDIKKFDTLDDETIMQVYEMRTLFNKVKLIRFITV